jgi:mono/diheme cytochrome c family protein
MFRHSWLGLVLLLFCLPLHAADAELPPGGAKAKVETACTECHAARIILQQRLSPAAWTKEVDKMVKWGAVVDPADRDAIVQYLSSNFPPGKPPDSETRTAAIKP